MNSVNWLRAVDMLFPGAVGFENGVQLMIDKTPEETRAIREGASHNAGEYLESIGKTDLATLTQEEWFTMLEVAVTGYQDCLRWIEMGEPPF